MDATFRIAASSHAGTVRITPAGELDVAASRDLETAIAAAVARAPAPAAVIVDLTDVTFLDSTIIAVLVTGQKAAADNGIRLTVVNARGFVERVLVIAGVYPHLRGSQP